MGGADTDTRREGDIARLNIVPAYLRSTSKTQSYTETYNVRLKRHINIILLLSKVLIVPN